MDHQADSWYRIIDEIQSRVSRRMKKDFGAIFDGKAALVKCQPHRLGETLITHTDKRKKRSRAGCVCFRLFIPRHCTLGMSLLSHYTRLFPSKLLLDAAYSAGGPSE